MPMLAAVTCLARRRRMHCRGSDAPAPELDRQGQHGPGDHRHHRRDEPAPVVVGMPGREQTSRSPRAPPSDWQGRRRLPRDGGPPALGSRRRRDQATVAAVSDGGRGSSAAVVLKKTPPAAGGARAGAGTASSPSSEASSSPVLSAVCLEEVRRRGEAAALPCSHSYHPGCVLPWLAAHGACPVLQGRRAVVAGRRRTINL